MSLTDGGPITVDDTVGGKTIVAINPKRRELFICNNDSTNSLWVSIGGTPLKGRGLHIPPYSWLPIDTRELPEYIGEVKGICDTGVSVEVSFAERSA